MKNKSNLKQTFVTQPNATNKNEFHLDLCRAIVAANIPFNAVENSQFKSFLEKYCHRSIPSESTLRKNYLDTLYENTLSRIREDIGDSYIWISVDETTDRQGRYMANLIVGKLDPDTRSVPHLICSKELKKTNQETIAHFVNKALKLLFPNSLDESKVLVIYTDAAPYMIAAVKLLKVFYPALLHITCLAHAMNRVAETIRLEFPKVNKLVSTIKKVFIKAPTRIQLFREELPNVPLPPEPILTRWGTWLEAVEYYSEHLEDIKNIVLKLQEEAVSITSAKDLLKDPAISNDIAYIKSHYSFLVPIIKALECSGKPVYKQLQLIEEVTEKIKMVPGSIGMKVSEKLQTVLQKKTGLTTLCTVADILSGKSTDHECAVPLRLVPSFKYAPVTSVDVERSFSAYKMLLTDKRCSFSTENLEKVLVIYCDCNYGHAQ